MEATYQLYESELTAQFLQGLKETFKGKRITISISASGEAGSTHTDLEMKVMAAAASSVRYNLSPEELARLADAVETQEPFDVVAEIEKYRTEK